MKSAEKQRISIYRGKNVFGTWKIDLGGSAKEAIPLPVSI